MKSRLTLTVATTAIALSALIATPARANDVSDIYKSLAVGLSLIDMNPRLTYSYLSGGWDLDFGNSYSNQTYDFGNVSLTLNGTIVGNVSLDTRGIGKLGYTLNTSGLGFELSQWSASGVTTRIENGLLTTAQNVTFDKYGCYSIQYDLYVQGDVVTQGVEGIEGSQHFATELGPIDVRGHWMVDVFNFLFADSLGFYLPGGIASYAVLGEDASLSNLTDTLLKRSAAKELELPPLANATMVPEPASMLILLAGLPMLRRMRAA